MSTPRRAKARRSRRPCGFRTSIGRRWGTSTPPSLHCAPIRTSKCICIIGQTSERFISVRRKENTMNLEELKKLKEKAQRQVALREGNKKYRVVFSMGTSGIAAGAREVMTTMLDELDKRGIENVEVAVTGEIGLVDAEPMVRVEEASGEKVTYAK